METTKGKIEVEEIKLIAIHDTNPDTSWLGKYHDDPTDDHSICRCCGEYIEDLDDDHEMPSRGREYRFFKPEARNEKPGTDDYKKYGKQDYARMEQISRGDVWFIGIRAEAELKVETNNGNSFRSETLSSSGLWGIESDSDDDYKKEIGNEQLSELRDYLESFGLEFEDEKWEEMIEDLEID